MPYKPKYCCQCGDQIERTDWSLTSSRRFCELCETEFKIYDWLPRIALAVGIFFSIVGLGTYWQKSGKTIDTAPKQFAGYSPNSNKYLTNKAVEPQVLTGRGVPILEQTPANDSDGDVKLTAAVPALNAAKSKPLETIENAVVEKVYYCGAQTKKGSACSRKVKGGGRCWQHTGQPAMLPQEKLLVTQ